MPIRAVRVTVAARAIRMSRRRRRACSARYSPVREANEGVAQTSGVSQSIARDIAAVDHSARSLNASAQRSLASCEELTALAGQLNRVVASFQFEA